MTRSTPGVLRIEAAERLNRAGTHHRRAKLRAYVPKESVRLRPALHPVRPAQEPRQLPSAGPGEVEEFAKCDPIRMNALVCFDSPEQIRAAPWSKPVSPGGFPEKAKHYRRLADDVSFFVSGVA